MHHSIVSRSQGSPLPEIFGCEFSLSFLFKFLLKNAHFARSLVQLILAALSLYLFGTEEGSRRGFLSDAPFGQFCLATYLSDEFALGPLPFGAEEGLRKGLFSDAPFGQFCLAAYLPKGMPLAMHHLLVLARGAESYIAKRRDSGRAERYIAKRRNGRTLRRQAICVLHR